LVESIKNSYSENKKHYEKGLVYFAGEYMNILDIIDIATNPNIGSNIGVEILLNEDEPDTRVVIITDKIYSYPKRTLTVTIKTNYSQDGNDIIPFNHNNPRPNQVYIKIEYKEMTGGLGYGKATTIKDLAELNVRNTEKGYMETTGFIVIDGNQEQALIHKNP